MDVSGGLYCTADVVFGRYRLMKIGKCLLMKCYLNEVMIYDYMYM